MVSRQAHAIAVGMVLFTGAYVRVVSIAVIGGTPALPEYEFKCEPVEGTATPEQLTVRARSCSYVSVADWFSHRKPPATARLLHLVSCVSIKLDRAAPARDFYCSPWFKLVRSHVEREPWAILSARYGFVWPEQILTPYDDTLNSKSAPERQLWAGRVLAEIPAAQRYVLWAGSRYAEHLAAPLRAELPLRGLGIGQQLSFLKRAA